MLFGQLQQLKVKKTNLINLILGLRVALSFIPCIQL